MTKYDVTEDGETSIQIEYISEKSGQVTPGDPWKAKTNRGERKTDLIEWNTLCQREESRYGSEI